MPAKKKAKPAAPRKRKAQDPTPTLVEIIRRYEEVSKKLQALYSVRDALETAMLTWVENTGPVKLPPPDVEAGDPWQEGDTFDRQDNFLDKDGNVRNYAFRPARVPRWTLVFRTPIKGTKRAKRKPAAKVTPL